MKLLLWVIIITTGCLLLACTTTPQQIFRNTSPSVLRIINFDIQDGKPVNLRVGSAVAISKKLIATNCHVALPGKFSAVLVGKKGYFARLLEVNKSQDVCLLYVSAGSFIPVKIKDTRNVQIGERVFAIGYPTISRTNQLYFSEGIVSSIVPKNDLLWLYVSTTLSFGSSGGGLFDENQNLIGLTTGADRANRNIVLVASTGWILQKLAESTMAPGIALPPPTPEAPSPASPAPAQSPSMPSAPEPAPSPSLGPTPVPAPSPRPVPELAPSPSAKPPLPLQNIGSFGSNRLAVYKVGNKCLIYVPGRNKDNAIVSSAFWTPYDPASIVILPNTKTAEEGADRLRSIVQSPTKGGRPRQTANYFLLDSKRFFLFGGDQVDGRYPLLAIRFSQDPTSVLTSRSEFKVFLEKDSSYDEITFGLDQLDKAIAVFPTQCQR